MPSILQMLPLIISQNLGKQELQRTPEPDAITSDTQHVAQYDRVMETKLAISYAIAIETIYRARAKPFGGKSLDIACGPGHFSITMAKELKLNELVGVDLSAPMVQVASNNATEKGMNHLRFQTGDATSLTDFGENEFDLTTMMDAAHHIPSLEMVSKVLMQMDRVTRPDGLIVMMDLVRLRTKELTEKYVHLLAHDYAERGLPSFLDDFRNSMYAAWTPSELASTVPAKSKRKWKTIVPRGIPFAQFIVGHAEDQKLAFPKRKPLWKQSDLPVSPTDRAEYNIAYWAMEFAKTRTM